MKFEIRREIPEDYRAVEELTREAFWNLNAPGCTEHYLVHQLRAHADFLAELSCVAIHGAEIVGSIAYSRSRVEETPTVTFGPLSVLPVYQGRAWARRWCGTRCPFAGRWAFGPWSSTARRPITPALAFSRRKRSTSGSADGMYAAALQVLELRPGALRGVRGRFFESPVFEVDVRAAEAFDRDFPRRQKRETPSQREFQKIAAMRQAARAR